jgi:hypothetical protein
LRMTSTTICMQQNSVAMTMSANPLFSSCFQGNKWCSTLELVKDGFSSVFH